MVTGVNGLLGVCAPKHVGKERGTERGNVDAQSLQMEEKHAQEVEKKQNHAY